MGFFAAFLKIAKIWKQPVHPSTNKRIKKMRCAYACTHTHTHMYIHTQMEYYSAMRKKGILLFARIWMKLEDIMLCGMSGKERQILYDSNHMWNLKLPNSQKQTGMVVALELWGRWGKGDVGHSTSF